MERGPALAADSGMSEHKQPEQHYGREEQGAKEEQTQKIDAIIGDEVLGYEGTAHGEHSGQDSAKRPVEGDKLEDRLAHNRPAEVK
jgi:hypothetical protein